MEIVKQTENKLLGRKEYVIKMQNTGATPKRMELKKEIAKKLKIDESLVNINFVGHQYGSSDLKIRAKAYDNEKSLKMNARPHMVKRNNPVAKTEEN